MPSLTLADGDKLAFEFEGSGEPVLLVSGLGGRGDYWRGVSEFLRRRFLVVSHDHHGTGNSSRRTIDFSIEQMANDTLALADHLGLSRFHVIGHSTGGAIAQTLALDHSDRIRKLVLSATWPGRDSYVESLFTFRRDVLEQMGVPAYQRLANLMLKPPSNFASLLPQVLAGDADKPWSDAQVVDARNLSRRIVALLAFDRRHELHRIEHPCLVSCAKDDVIIPPHLSRELHDRLANSEFKMFSHGGHAYTDVHAHEFSEDVIAFLSEPE